jgi:hypothetical protein
MAKRFAINPRVRHLLMQGVLVLVLLCAVGLAALVTRRVRMGMRVELAEARTHGRLIVRLPAKWVVTTASVERGDEVDAEEPPGDQQPGRRLRILRQRSDGLIPPMGHLFRSGRVKAEALRWLVEGREGFEAANVEVAGWPGRMVTMLASPRAGVVHKDLIACAVLPDSQAVVVHLEGVGPVDASDRELVRQMSENVSLAFVNRAPRAKGREITLVDGVVVRVPAHYLEVPIDDVNQHQRQLLLDGTGGGGWVAIDLAACVFFEGEKDEALLAMLAARDANWRSGAVKRLDARTMMVERVDAGAGTTPAGVNFPARAYLRSHDDGRALMVVMRGGLRDGRLLDSAWESIASGVRFEGRKDFSALLANGAEAAASIGRRGLGQLLSPKGALSWWMWDYGENADKELWSQSRWEVEWRGEGDAAVANVTGKRTSRPSDVYATDTQFEQEWSAAGDLSKYTVTTHREVRRAAGGTFGRPTLEQRVTVDGSRMSLYCAGGPGQVEMERPAQYVPGAVLPLVLRELAEKPSLIKTESFVGVETVAGPGLLTLMVTRLDASAPTRPDEKGVPLDCVSVGVSGSGVVSRWYYTHDSAELRFVDFEGRMKAQSGE